MKSLRMNETQIKKKFGNNVQLYRKANFISQEELATLINKKRTYISQLENGKHFASAETISKLCAVLKCSVKDLFNF